jgi:hypothetical protein
MAAMYPSFGEDCPPSLSPTQRSEILRIRRIAPGVHRGLSITEVIDRAVRADIAPDLSHRTAQQAFRRPLRTLGAWHRAQMAG